MATINGENTLINSLTGLQTIKGSDGTVVENHMNTEQVMGYFLTAVVAFIVYKVAPSAKNAVANLF